MTHLSWSASRRILAIALTVTLGSVGCSGDTESDSSSPTWPGTSSARPAADAASGRPSKPLSERVPNLPNIALHPDGKTPVLCSEWRGLSNDIQHGLVVNAMVKLKLFPASGPRVTAGRRIVTTDCKGEADSVAYVVAMRAAMEVIG